jgi:hypothetical protein
VTDIKNMRSGAMPSDWHERNDTGYLPDGKAEKIAEKILSEPYIPPQDEPSPFYRNAKEAEEGNRPVKPGPEPGYDDPWQRVRAGRRLGPPPRRGGAAQG